MVTIAVYGSLKRNKYNSPMLEGCERIGHSVVRGIMWLVSSYPAFVVSDDEDDKVYEHAFELYQVDDDTHKRIRSMELGAGYDEEEREFTLNESGEVVKALFYPAGKDLQDYCEKNRPVVSNY